jgi:hypothetical protein
MRISRDLIVVVFLFAVLSAVTAFSVQRRAELEAQQETYIPYSTHSAGADGTLALQAWLSVMGFDSRRLENEPFEVPAAARALFVFPTRQAYSDEETRAVLRWVENGNTLIVSAAGVTAAGDPLAKELQFKLLPVGYVNRAAMAQPLNGLAPAGDVLVRTAWGLELARADYVQVVGTAEIPLLVSWSRGKGAVILTSAPFLFSNDGLRDDANATLTLALLSRVPRGSVIALDEFHLAGGRSLSGCAASWQSLLVCWPWGWALIYAFAVVGTYLTINGRRFGRVLPLPREVARRSPAEYVLSMSQLFRRAGKRNMIAQHYRRQLKRSLARPYRIKADLPDDEFIAELSRYRDVEREALLGVLNALNRPQTSERSLLRLADEAIRLRRQAEHGS